MEKSLRKSAVLYTLTALIILALDIFSKNLAELYLFNKEITLLPFLHLVLVYNKGAAFGIFAQTEGLIRFITLILVPSIAVVLTFWYAIKENKKGFSIIMGAIAGGALGNLYDRIFLGYVRDFIYLQYGKLSWPAFNIADMSISLAIFTFLVLQYTQQKQKHK